MGIKKRLGYSKDYAKVLADFDANYKEMIERIGKVPEAKKSSDEENPKKQTKN
jgi:hypothetical protein